jgi:hypothetical protein
MTKRFGGYYVINFPFMLYIQRAKTYLPTWFCFIGHMLYNRLGVNNSECVIYVNFFSSVQHDKTNLLGNFRLQLCTHIEMFILM